MKSSNKIFQNWIKENCVCLNHRNLQKNYQVSITLGKNFNFEYQMKFRSDRQLQKKNPQGSKTSLKKNISNKQIRLIENINQTFNPNQNKQMNLIIPNDNKFIKEKYREGKNVVKDKLLISNEIKTFPLENSIDKSQNRKEIIIRKQVQFQKTGVFGGKTVQNLLCSKTLRSYNVSEVTKSKISKVSTKYEKKNHGIDQNKANKYNSIQEKVNLMQKNPLSVSLYDQSCLGENNKSQVIDWFDLKDSNQLDKFLLNKINKKKKIDHLSQGKSKFIDKTKSQLIEGQQELNQNDYTQQQ